MSEIDEKMNGVSGGISSPETAQDMQPEVQSDVSPEPDIVQIDKDAKDGQTKCPKCGSTDISTNLKTGKLRCNFCRHEFELERAFEEDEKIDQLEGFSVGTGAADIDMEFDNIVTLKCESCGAEVVIDTSRQGQARCHWCRNTLSINNKLPNGAVPDALLPFKVQKSAAQEKIRDFVEHRKFFAHPTFTKEFTTDNIMSVYLPYMIVDINAHSSYSGTGEKLVRSYEVTVGRDKDGKEETETRYDADAYHVQRNFDIAIDDLTIEASRDKLDTESSEKTTNIINAIMPFDTENCVKFDANFLKNATSEKRDVDVKQIRGFAKEKAKDIAKFAANDTMDYDRGVSWDKEEIDIKGESWKAVYLPIWLYSYLQKKNGKNLLHYVAVNARTEKTMGSVPINYIKLITVSILIALFGGIAAYILGTDAVGVDSDWRWLLTLSGPAFFAVMYSKYRNSDARHYYEIETKHQIRNLKKEDTFFEYRNGLTNSEISGRNDCDLSGSCFKMDEFEV